MKALVVDDSRAMRAILGRSLKQLGFEVVEAAHGRDGLAQLEKVGALDLVLVDWNMPEMNGLEFVTAVRGEHGYDSMRVMMVTTESDVGHVSLALSAGANEYLMKPFTPEALREKLATLGIEL